jgi:hypothetical protein
MLTNNQQVLASLSKDKNLILAKIYTLSELVDYININYNFKKTRKGVLRYGNNWFTVAAKKAILRNTSVNRQFSHTVAIQGMHKTFL